MALRGTLTHRKIRRLAQALGIAPCYALGVAEAMWHVAGEQSPNGAIGRMRNADLAMEMFFDGDPDVLVEALVTAELLDRDPVHRLIVHDWHIHSDDATDNKLTRSTQLYANGSIPRMNRLSLPERQKACARYRTAGHFVRTECHKMPLPEPVPEPKTNTKPLASTATAVPAERGKLLGTILLNRGEYEVREDDLARDGPLYPGVDVVAEYRAMKAWSIANPSHRKTRKGIARHMNQWLAQAQNRSRSPGGSNGTNRINLGNRKADAAQSSLERAQNDLWGASSAGAAHDAPRRDVFEPWGADGPNPPGVILEGAR